MNSVICAQCSAVFMPNEKGYNAKYCSKNCKVNAREKYRIPVLTLEEKRAARRKSYLATKAHPDRLERHRESGAKGKTKIRDWIFAYKLERGCTDCGYRGHPAALQFDHTGEKKAYISAIRSSIARLLKEIEGGKCVIRCARCHAVKTWAEKNGMTYDPKMVHPT